MDKKRLAVVSILVVLSIILFVILYMLINENKNLKAENNKLSNSQIENNNEINKPVKNEIIELDIDSKLVGDLYKYILKHNIASEETVYQNKKISVNHLDDIIKTLTVFSNIDVEKECYKKEYDKEFSHDEYSKYYFNKNFIDNKVKAIFGDDALIDLKDEIVLLGTKINFVNDEYVFTKYPGGGETQYYSNSKVIKAEKQGDNLYIYDKYIHVVEAGGTTCYNASDRQKILLKKDESYLDLKVDDVENADTFKHTFTKNEDGSYYWVSTEIVR